MAMEGRVIYSGSGEGFYDVDNFKRAMRDFKDVELIRDARRDLGRWPLRNIYSIECAFGHARSREVLLRHVFDDSLYKEPGILSKFLAYIGGFSGPYPMAIGPGAEIDLFGETEDVGRVERAVIDESLNWVKSGFWSETLHDVSDTIFGVKSETPKRRLLETPQTPPHILDLFPPMREDYLRANVSS